MGERKSKKQPSPVRGTLTHDPSQNAPHTEEEMKSRETT